MKTSDYFAPEGKASESRASPPPGRGTGSFLPEQREDSRREIPPANPNLHMGKRCLPGTEYSG